MSARLPASAEAPSDEALRDAGLAPEGRGRVLLIACGALAREILTLKKANGWEHLDLQCLPAILHNTPQKIVPAIEAAVAEARENYAQVFVVYADCGTGGLLKAACDRMGVELVPGPHCYSFYEGNDAFAAREEATAFYLTDFLVRQFDAFVWKPLGLDRHPELRQLYFGNYETMVYEAQTDDPALTEKARGCAERLGLAFERRFTGYGDLGRVLGRL